MVDQGGNKEDLMEDPLDHKEVVGRAITWKETWGAPSERKMLHPPDQEPNRSHLVNCRRRQQLSWQKAKLSQSSPAARCSTPFRAVRMQSEMCWLGTLALEVNSRVVINKVKVVIKDLHLVAFRVVEEVVETLEEGLKAVVATIMGDLAWEEDPIALVECKEAAGMRGTLGDLAWKEDPITLVECKEA